MKQVNGRTGRPVLCSFMFCRSGAKCTMNYFLKPKLGWPLWTDALVLHWPQLCGLTTVLGMCAFLICSVQALEADGMIMKRAVAHETTVHTYLLLMNLVQTEIRTAEALMSEPRAFEVEMAIEKPKRHKSRGIDQIPLHLIKTGDMTPFWHP